MSFSSDVKKEIANLVPAAKHCGEAALGALIECQGSFSRDDAGHLILSFSTDNSAVAGKYFTLLQKTTNINTTWHEPGCRSETDLDSMGMEEAEAFCRRLSDTERLLKRECCKRAWLREFFLCSGSVTNPSREYHLEFITAEEKTAEKLIKVLSAWGIQGRMTRRKKNIAVYLKDSAAIGEILSLIGAHSAYLELENTLILKEMRNTINRRVNLETANIVKAVDAAQRQIDDIQLLERKGALKALPDVLQQMARLRLQYPDATLKELGAMLNPPVGKSGVNHRLRRLSEIADEARTGDSGGEL